MKASEIRMLQAKAVDVALVTPALSRVCLPFYRNNTRRIPAQGRDDVYALSAATPG